MERARNNYVFIDSQNLQLSIKELGWFLDFKRFRVYLSEKYGVDRAHLSFVSDLETRVKRKEPRKDEALKGAFHGDLMKE